MKPTSILIPAVLLIFIISSCGCRQNSDQLIPIKHNYVIVLDLSDRLLNKGQTQKDSALIMTAFNEFEKIARSPLIVTSNDRFIVRIIPQKGSPLRQDYFENKLNIDLSGVDAAHKNGSFASFKSGLSATISDLYKAAYLGGSSKNYAGVDIWQFFNNEINTELRPDAANKVIIVTDGYFDFNDNSSVVHRRNQHTNTNFINGLKGVDWKANAVKDSIGLIPVSIQTKATWIIAGLQPKNSDILMADKLAYFWEKWLVESGANSPKIILDNSSSVMVNQYCNQ